MNVLRQSRQTTIVKCRKTLSFAQYTNKNSKRLAKIRKNHLLFDQPQIPPSRQAPMNPAQTYDPPTRQEKEPRLLSTNPLDLIEMPPIPSVSIDQNGNMTEAITRLARLKDTVDQLNPTKLRPGIATRILFYASMPALRAQIDYLTALSRLNEDAASVHDIIVIIRQNIQSAKEHIAALDDYMAEIARRKAILTNAIAKPSAPTTTQDQALGIYQPVYADHDNQIRVALDNFNTVLTVLEIQKQGMVAGLQTSDQTLGRIIAALKFLPIFQSHINLQKISSISADQTSKLAQFHKQLLSDISSIGH